MTANFLIPPIDPTAAASLAGHGLRFALLDTSDTAAFEAWVQGMTRGFHGITLSAEALPPHLVGMSGRRIAGVWDDSAADPITPIATASSWIADLTVPGERSVPAWAISTITVAPTHRRRGIARDMLEAELRTAAALGVPVAMLTVSEATIYARYGFAPSVFVADWKIDTRRSKWTGRTPSGRVQLVPIEAVRDDGGHRLLDRVRLLTPGQMQFDGRLWTRLFTTPASEESADVRVARYDDAEGRMQGFVIYRIGHEPHDVAIANVEYLAAATGDAYAALWRYVLELDLVDSVVAKLRPVVEPMRWQVTDARSVAKTAESDHLWTRILNVKAALEARSYGAPGHIVLEIADPLGFAAGRYRLDIADDGTAIVASSEDAPDLAMSVNELSAIYLGGVSIDTLVRAGHIAELKPGAALAADASFRSAVTPWLSIWF